MMYHYKINIVIYFNSYKINIIFNLLYFLGMENKESQYKYVLAELKSFYEKYNNKQYRLSLNSKYTSIVSLLKNHVSGLFFVGFYEVVEVVDLEGNKTGKYFLLLNHNNLGEKYLEIGAYQSTILATPRIAYGKG